MSRARKILEKYAELNEVAARRTISFRGGSRHIRYKCPPGWKKVGRSCSKIQASVRIARGRELKKAWRRRKGKMPRQRIASKRTFRKMRQSGYKPGGGRR